MDLKEMAVAGLMALGIAGLYRWMTGKNTGVTK